MIAPEDADTGEGEGDGGEPPESLSTTQRLASRARAGDDRSLGELCERVAPALFVWTSVRVRPEHRRSVDPEDIVQEVWIRVLGRLGSYDPAQKPFRAWVFGIAKNVAREAWRRARRGPQPGPGQADRSDAFGVSQKADTHATEISHRVARNEALLRFIDRVRGLDPTDREILIFCGLEGETAAETAVKLGLSRAAVLQRWLRLRGRMQEQGCPEELFED